jgi:hypothetical protein
MKMRKRLTSAVSFEADTSAAAWVQHERPGGASVG